MPDFLILVKATLPDTPDEAISLAYELEEDFDVAPVGVYGIPIEDANYCECDRKKLKLGIRKTKKLGWATCSKCGLALKTWHHVPKNLIEEEADPEAQVFLNYQPETSETYRNWREKLRNKT